MKFFACIALIVALSVVDAAVTSRNAQGVEGVEGADHQQVNQAENTEVAAAESDVVRMRKSAKSAYAPAPAPWPATSYTYQSPAPTVPCGRNLLFSCQPSVAPVPCSAPAPSYPSYAGAYSEPIPMYAVPQFQTGHYGGEYHYRY